MPTVYEIITNRIITLLEKGVIPWRKPWNAPTPRNYITKRPYRGINLFLLAHSGFNSPYWLTFKQIKDLGGCVKAGEKATPIVFWKWIEKEDVNPETGETEIITFPVLRYYHVFNLEQTKGIKKPTEKRGEFEPIQKCQEIVDNMPNPPKIIHNGEQACYYPSLDIIYMPEPECFHKKEEYYATLFHELVHSTGHKKRLNRKTIVYVTPFGSPDYSKEELIAEMGASFLCAFAGIENVTIENQAAYINNWLQVLKNDRRLVVQATAQAQRAVDHIIGSNTGEQAV